MALYNGIVGIDERALNGFITGAYDCTRKSVFHGTVPVAHLRLGHLESVEYDVATTPRVLLSPSGLIPGAGSQASFELVVDQMAIVLHYAGGLPATTVEGAVRAGAELIADSNGYLVPRLTGAIVDIPNEPTLEDIINKVALPFVERYVRDELLAPIRVPPLGYGRVNLSSPTVRTGDGRLTATASIAPAVADAATSGPWPDGRIFIAADFDLVNKVASQFTATQRGTWSKKVDFGIGTTTLKADYTATVTGLTLSPVQSRPDQLAASAVVTVDVHCYAKNLFSLNAKGSTKAGVTAKAVFADNSLAIQFVELKEFTLNLDIKKVARLLDKQISNFIAANVLALRGPLSATLAAQPPLQVGALPSFELDLCGTTIKIQVADPRVATIVAPDGRTLVSASGVPEVQSAP